MKGGVTQPNTHATQKGYITGIASEFLVLSLLHRLGLEAYMSLGNKKSVDLRLVRPDGTTATIEVKAVRAYSSFVINNLKPAKNHYVVFVRYRTKFSDPTTQPDVYVVPSAKIRRLQSRYADQIRILEGKIRHYKDRWDNLYI